jgi:hydroxymethylpyrimidine/phosphomethylpyrimidine kinase
MKTALTIAGSDSSGGAGIQADIKTFQALGVFAMSAITAVTVQNTQKVYAVQELRPDIVQGQISCLFEDIEIHALKMGMVSSSKLISAIAETLRSITSLPPLVLDPVMVSKSGYRLLDSDAQKALVEELFPLAWVVTPNILEAEALLNRRIESAEDMQSAAEKIHQMGATNVVLKGGHRKSKEATDIIFAHNRFEFMQAPRIETPNTHGTGCTFSSAIAANLALGLDIFEAVRGAKEYVSGAIAHSLAIGKGCGPTNHFFDLYAKAGLD